MADEQKECPTCHSYISEDPENTEQGSEQSGTTVQITDPFTNQQVNVRTSTSGAVPQWTDDPTVTFRGFNGEEYIGFNRVRATHIRELQYARLAEEEEAGIPEEMRTKFSEVFQEHIRKLHIIELRESTEKILDSVGGTLKEYFKTNLLEEEKEPGPNDEADKEEWTDVERGAEYLAEDGTIKTEFTLPSGIAKPSPTLPIGTHVKAIHIEDLRHPLHLGWREFWSVTPDTVIDIKTATSKVRTENTTYIQGSIVNAPTVVPGGFDDFTEYSLSALPVGFGQKEIQIGSPSQRSTTVTIITATEQAAKGFPSGFDLHPTDAGAQYFYDFVNENDAEPAYGTKTTDPETNEVTYEIDKTWIVEGFCVDYKYQRFGAALYSAGQSCPFENEVSGSSNIHHTSDAKFEIVNTRDSLVERAKETAKTLKLVSNSKTNLSVGGIGRGHGGLSADSWVSVSHTWSYSQNEDKFTAYPIGRLSPETNFQNFDTWTAQAQTDVELFKDRGIGVKFNTHFKFFAHLKLEGDATKFGQPNSGIANEQVYLDRLRNYERAQLQDTTPVNEFTGVIDFGDTNSILPPIFNTVAGGDDFEIVPIHDVYPICLLAIRAGSRRVFCKLILSDPPTGSSASYITQSSGLFGGQTFKFITPPSNNNGNIMTVYLGEGDGGKYDQVINIDDLLTAWRNVPSSGFSYTSHKQMVDGNVVENPAGTLTSFTWCRFFLGTKAEPVLHSGSVEQNQPFPACTITVNEASAENFEVKATMELSAIRIEGNNKKLADLPENE